MKRVLFILIMIVATWVAITLTSDVAWCVENYSVDRIPHCMYYENSITGKYVQPPLALSDWSGRYECYSTEFR